MLISNMTILFQTYSRKYRNNAFWSQIRFFFVLHDFLHFCKFEDADFKYNTSLGQNTQIRHFWFHLMLLLLSLLLFCSILGISINSKVLISNITLAFSNFNLKILKKGLFGPNLKIFIFAQNFAF